MKRGKWFWSRTREGANGASPHVRTSQAKSQNWGNILPAVYPTPRAGLTGLTLCFRALKLNVFSAYLS